MSGYKVNTKDKNGNTVFVLASQFVKVEDDTFRSAASTLKQDGANIKYRLVLTQTTPLAIASKCSNYRLVSQFLYHGVNSEARDRASPREHQRTVELLVQHKAKLESMDLWHRPPLANANAPGHEYRVALNRKESHNRRQHPFRRTPFKLAYGCGIIRTVDRSPGIRLLNVASGDLWRPHRWGLPRDLATTVLSMNVFKRPVRASCLVHS